MDLKDIQGRLKQLSEEQEIPAIQNDKKNKSLTQKIIKEDRKDRLLLMIGIISIVSVVIYYAILSYRCIHFGRDRSELLFYGFASAGFLSALPLLIHKYRKIGRFDYAEDTVAFLKKAEKRFRFLCEEFMYLIPFFVLFDVAICCVVIYKMDFWGLSVFIRILIVQALMIPYYALPALIAYLHWKKKRRPILQEIQELRKQFVDDPVPES
ncbi:MAG: hypothetical protein ACEPOZ_00710 [Marinifilaceae bacterium]|jgi:hypothetical protein